MNVDWAGLQIGLPMVGTSTSSEWESSGQPPVPTDVPRRGARKPPWPQVALHGNPGWLPKLLIQERVRSRCLAACLGGKQRGLSRTSISAQEGWGNSGFSSGEQVLRMPGDGKERVLMDHVSRGAGWDPSNDVHRPVIGCQVDPGPRRNCAAAALLPPQTCDRKDHNSSVYCWLSTLDINAGCVGP